MYKNKNCFFPLVWKRKLQWRGNVTLLGVRISPQRSQRNSSSRNSFRPSARQVACFLPYLPLTHQVLAIVASRITSAPCQLLYVIEQVTTPVEKSKKSILKQQKLNNQNPNKMKNKQKKKKNSKKTHTPPRKTKQKKPTPKQPQQIHQNQLQNVNQKPSAEAWKVTLNFIGCKYYCSSDPKKTGKQQCWSKLLEPEKLEG